jgi:hypothetical protein
MRRETIIVATALMTGAAMATQCTAAQMPQPTVITLKCEGTYTTRGEALVHGKLKEVLYTNGRDDGVIIVNLPSGAVDVGFQALLPRVTRGDDQYIQFSGQGTDQLNGGTLILSGSINRVTGATAVFNTTVKGDITVHTTYEYTCNVVKP